MAEVLAESSPQQPTTAEAWAPHIERAVGGLGLQSVFQPIIDLQRRTIAGYEALTRFDPIDGVNYSPDKWFAAAGALGLGAELDAAALASTMMHRHDIPANCFLSINVDPDSLSQKCVMALLMAQGSLGGVVIEITEHRRWDWPQLGQAAERLRSIGALFAVDDTGAGYSGLQQVLQLRPSILKLDCSLVTGLDRDEAKSSLVEMLGVFANRVDAWILAEGVETLGEAKRLVELEVPLCQGYYFGQPGAGWAEIDPLVVADLGRHARTSNDNLYRYVEPVTPLGPGEPTSAWMSRSEHWIAVIDHDRRPLGLVDGEAAISGELIPSLVVNVHSCPAEVANRLATAGTEPSAPTIVTDNAGRYLGLLTVRRLLSILAQQAEATGQARR